MKTFGITFHGQHAIIKFNAKLDNDNREFMQASYPTLNISITIPKHGKELVRIEGCMLANTYHAFKLELDKAILRTKMNADHAKLEKLESMDRVPTQYELHDILEQEAMEQDSFMPRFADPLDDLPF